jgi:hypothetical protein
MTPEFLLLIGGAMAGLIGALSFGVRAFAAVQQAKADIHIHKEKQNAALNALRVENQIEREKRHERTETQLRATIEDKVLIIQAHYREMKALYDKSAAEVLRMEAELKLVQRELEIATEENRKLLAQNAELIATNTALRIEITAMSDQIRKTETRIQMLETAQGVAHIATKDL